MEISFIVPGRVQAKERPRRGRAGNFYTPSKTANYEREVKWWAKLAMRGHKLILGPVEVDIEILATIPPSWHKIDCERALRGEKYPPRGDVDNCGKSICDAMNGIVYKDDRQITKLTISKKYALEARAIVRIR